MTGHGEGAPAGGLARAIWRRKPLGDFHAEAHGEGDGHALPRSLGWLTLTAFGVGGTVGAGIFVLTGVIAADHAGPGVVLAFLLAAAVSALASLCYAEFSAMLPVSGSAYSYAYATFGEGTAWMIGWLLLLEWLISASLVAIGWSGYFRSALADIGVHIPDAVARAPFDVTHGHVVATGSLLDLPAVAMTLACTALMLAGTKLSARVNVALAAIKIGIILLFILAGLPYVRLDHFHPFIPANAGSFGHFGWSGVIQGAGIGFFAFVGLDGVSTLAREAHRPQRTVPLALIASLLVCALLYIGLSFVLVGITDWRTLGVADPVYAATAAAGPGMAWLKPLVAASALIGLFSVVLFCLVGQVRIFLAMGRDGLLPPAFARIDPGTGVPRFSTLVTGGVAAVVAGVFPLGLLGELISIGTLLAFAVVCLGIVILRRTMPDVPRPFRVPASPWLPILGAVSCIYLMTGLPGDTWLRLVLWVAAGAAVYAFYGSRRARLAGPRSTGAGQGGIDVLAKAPAPISAKN